MYDNAQRYGVVSRALHWLMAAGFGFMLFTALMWHWDEEYFSLMNAHKSVGVILLILLMLRVAWALINGRHRPLNTWAAKAGHLALYVLMLVVPMVGLLRQYGAARGDLNVFGITVMHAAEHKIVALTELGNRAHGKLAWMLFILVVGHVSMAIYHQLRGEKILQRMLGK